MEHLLAPLEYGQIALERRAHSRRARAGVTLNFFRSQQVLTISNVLNPIRRRSIGWDIAILTMLCVPLYLLLPTHHGLRDTQESLRALGAEEMRESGDWMVPTVHGQPYPGKPPLIYWCQLWLNRLLGGQRMDGLELRLTAAFAGWLGVVTTYLLVRQLLREQSQPDPDGAGGKRWADAVAWWAALFLAIGPLYVRESRVGHIDTLLVPCTVIGVWGISSAWRAQREENRTHWAAIGVATLAATVAALAKGPPGMATIAAAGYGGVALHAAWCHTERGAPARRTLTFAGSFILGSTLTVLAWANGEEPVTAKSLIGSAVIFVAGCGMFWTLARFADPQRRQMLWRALRRTQPLTVLGIPLIILWGWAQIVKGRIGESAFTYRGGNVIITEIHWLTPYAPFNYLELLVYGLGLGSIAAIVAVVWMVKDRPRILPNWWIVFSWIVVTFLIFALMSGGTRRYIMSMWPAVATFGAMWFVSALRDLRAGRSMATAAYAVVLISAVGLGWWYALGREVFLPHHSPRALVEELAARGTDLTRIATLDLYDPALDVYTGQLVRFFFISDSAEAAYPHVPVPFGELVEELKASGGSYTLLIRASRSSHNEMTDDLERLRRFGLSATPIPLEARLTVDKDTMDVRVVEVRAASPDGD